MSIIVSFIISFIIVHDLDTSSRATRCLSLSVEIMSLYGGFRYYRGINRMELAEEYDRLMLLRMIDWWFVSSFPPIFALKVNKFSQLFLLFAWNLVFWKFIYLKDQIIAGGSRLKSNELSSSRVYKMRAIIERKWKYDRLTTKYRVYLSIYNRLFDTFFLLSSKTTSDNYCLDFIRNEHLRTFFLFFSISNFTVPNRINVNLSILGIKQIYTDINGITASSSRTSQLNKFVPLDLKILLEKKKKINLHHLNLLNNNRIRSQFRL